MKIMILGSNGLLGQSLIQLFIQKQVPFLATAKNNNRVSVLKNQFYLLDITKKQEAERVVSLEKPTVVINAAGMTNVDYCESNPKEAYELNTTAVKGIADICEQKGIKYIQISTCFLFDGTKKKYKYSELDKTNPLSVYALTKKKAEDYIIANMTNYAIVRTSVVFGTGESLNRLNLLAWTLSVLESNKQHIDIVDDQVRTPTFSDDLAMGCYLIAKKEAKGIYNIVGKEVMSVYDFFKRVASFYKYSTEKINKIASSAISQKAKRPLSTPLDITKAINELGYNPQSLEENLEKLNI